MTQGQSEKDMHSLSVANSLIEHLGAASHQRLLVLKPQHSSIIHFDWEQAALQVVKCRSCISEGLFETEEAASRCSIHVCLFLYLLKSHFRVTGQSVTATKRESLRFWNDFLNWSYLREWSENGATTLQMYWWTGLVLLFPAHCDCRTHHYLFTVIQRWGKQNRWSLNTVSKMQNKYLNIKQLRYRWSSSSSCVHILEIIKMKNVNY